MFEHVYPANGVRLILREINERVPDLLQRPVVFHIALQAITGTEPFIPGKVGSSIRSAQAAQVRATSPPRGTFFLSSSEI